MPDIFNKPDYTMKNPFTADACVVRIDGKDASYAVNVQVQYNQSITRRRTIGGEQHTAVIYGSLPNGQISIQRLGIKDAASIIGGDTFKGCGQGGTVTIELGGNCPEAGSLTYTCTGCIASSYGLSIEAEGLTVMDNVTIDFIQMKQG